MSAVSVEARFAGGAIVVDTDDVAGSPVVTVDMPGNTAAMFPDEARRFAVSLIEQAARAEAAPQEGVWP